MTAITVSNIAYTVTDRTLIEETIHQFVKATSDRNLHAMNHLLHEKFQTSQGAGVFSKSRWMELLDERKIGGVEERAEILLRHITEKSSSIKIRTTGGKGMTESFVHLTKNDLGRWQILHILPFYRIRV